MLDKLFYNGHFYTMEAEGQVFYAMGVQEGKIAGLYQGNELPEAAESIDIQGAYVLPGFIDSHLHLLNTINARGIAVNISHVVNGRLEPHDLKSVETLIRQAAAEAQDILVGNHYIIAAMEEARLPNRFELDAWAPGLDVVIYSMDLHSGSYSTSVLKALGIDPTDHDGILKGAEFEFNQGRVADFIAAKQEPRHQARGIAAFVNEAASYGITCVCALDGNDDSPEDLPTKAMVKYAGKLPIEVRLFVQYADPCKAACYQPYMVRKRLGGCGSWEMDGSIGSRSAAFKTHYRNEPDNFGHCYYSYEKCREMVRQGLLAGYQITVHAIGTEAIEEILQVFEELLPPGGDGRRHRIDHFEFPTMDQVKRAAALNLVVTVQPGYTWFDSCYQRSYEKFLEPAIIARQVPLAALFDAGIIVCGGSDCPVQEINPFLQIQGMVDFPIPEQSLSMYQAISTYTKNGAYALHEETCRGTLAPGKVADFMVLEKDPFSCPKDFVYQLKPSATYIAGEIFSPMDGTVDELNRLLTLETVANL